MSATIKCLLAILLSLSASATDNSKECRAALDQWKQCMVLALCGQNYKRGQECHINPTVRDEETSCNIEVDEAFRKLKCK